MNTGNRASAWAKAASRFRFGRSTKTASRPSPVLVVVEGRFDIEFLRRISRIMAIANSAIPDLPCLEQQGQLIFIPAGGDYVPWLDRLAAFGCPEVHIYDRETPPVTAQREIVAAAVNSRPGCRAIITRHRTLENYLHPDAIREARGLDLQFTGQDDVAAIAARASLALRSAIPWESLSRRGRQRLRNRAKAWLNTTAVERMTPERLAERDPAGEIPDWLATIARFAEGHPAVGYAS